MVYLLVVSIIWAFSFGLIKNALAGLDANFIAAARILVALLVFFPFIRIKGLSRLQIGSFILVGAIQYVVMYIAFNYFFQYLKAYEIALFSIFHPIYFYTMNDCVRIRTPFVSLLVLALP